MLLDESLGTWSKSLIIDLRNLVGEARRADTIVSLRLGEPRPPIRSFHLTASNQSPIENRQPAFDGRSSQSLLPTL